jgi:hypothetical protein
MASSPIDGYFVAVFISPMGDEAAARAKAWSIFTGPDHRPQPEPAYDASKDAIGDNEGDEANPRPAWMNYHQDPSGLVLRELGDEYVGSDGEGHFEVD